MSEQGFTYQQIHQAILSKAAANAMQHDELTRLRQRVEELERELQNERRAFHAELNRAMTADKRTPLAKDDAAVLVIDGDGYIVPKEIKDAVARLTTERDEAKALLERSMSRLNNWCDPSKAGHCPCQDCTLWREIKAALARHADGRKEKDNA